MPKTDSSLCVQDLCLVPEQRLAAAALVHQEFWTQVPNATVQRMADRLALAGHVDRIPLCLVALSGDRLVGVANVVDNDDDDHPQWYPWLAGVVVHADWRGRGIGSQLVRSAVQRAAGLGCERLYFGTDGPGFYQRLGAVVHEPVRADFWFMRFDLTAA